MTLVNIKNNLEYIKSTISCTFDGAIMGTIAGLLSETSGNTLKGALLGGFMGNIFGIYIDICRYKFGKDKRIDNIIKELTKYAGASFVGMGFTSFILYNDYSRNLLTGISGIFAPFILVLSRGGCKLEPLSKKDWDRINKTKPTSKLEYIYNYDTNKFDCKLSYK